MLERQVSGKADLHLAARWRDSGVLVFGVTPLTVDIARAKRKAS